MLEELFSRFKIGPVEIRNRIVMPPMVTSLANESGGVTQRMIYYYSERAKGGVGLIIVEAAYVREEDREFGRLGIENPQLRVGLSELAESIQEQGAGASRTCEEFQSCGLPFFPIGDCLQVRDIGAAIQEGFRIAGEI